MPKAFLTLNAIQCAIFVAGWSWLKEYWGLTANIALVCALLQVVGGIGILLNRPKLNQMMGMLCLIGAAIIIGQYWAAADHLMEAYGSDARRIGEASRTKLWLAIPWGTFMPLMQTLQGGLKGLLPPAVALFIPWMLGTGIDEPTALWPAQAEQHEAAEAAFLLWQRQDAELPVGVGPATVLLTPFEDGEAGKASRGNGTTLKTAIEDALSRLEAPSGERLGLVLDVARAEYPKGAHVPAGDGGGLSTRSGRSPTVAWRPGKVGSKRVAPSWILPRARMKGHTPTEFDSTLATDSGAFPMIGGWTAPLELTAERALEAALNSGRMLARHQQDTGRFAYTVKGPSGRIRGKGYNFPRHAGTTWFLARLAQRTDDAEMWSATQAGLKFMAENTVHMDDGRAYLGDPRRSDGKAWVGTTALAVLAAVAADHPLALPWGRFIASSVDEHGQVRGEMKRSEGVHYAQKKNPYGQGQTTLAVAALVRAGHTEFSDTLARLVDYMKGDYAPGGAGRLFILDEHWTCLAALAIQDVTQEATGADICRAYLAKEAYKTPTLDRRLGPNAGAAGGLAEAVVAGAYIDETYTADALAYGQWFLQNVYQESDSVLLPKPMALLGGFRDNPYRLDVRMDAVQHIGSALLGVEALLSDVRPGSLP